MLKLWHKIWNPVSGIIPLFCVLFLTVMWVLPFLVPKADAVGQLTTRSLQISSGVPLATGVSYTFTFTPENTNQVQGLKLIACTSAIGTYPTGTCTQPTGMTGASGLGNGFWNATFGSQTGWQVNTNNFAVDATGANDCTPAANVICLNRTDTNSQTITSRTIVLNNVKNPNVSVGSPAGTPFYVGIYTYSTTNYTVGGRVDFGATASAVVQSLTTAAAVAEVLNFCVGSTTVDGVNPVTDLLPADCTGVTGTSVNLGTLDSSQVNISPWTTDGGDSNNGLAMVRSNAGNGTVIAYDAIQQTGTNHTGTLRISGSTCNTPGNNFTDPCINAAGSQTVFIPGTEKFGMTIAGINSTSTTSYSCTYGGPGNTCDLEPLTGYLGGGTAGAEQYGSANGFAWDESGTAVNIASSASSTVKQIDDEGLILKFAATPSITTPFGQYQAKMDMIAMPTY